jgi:7-cyano-7-deazaguanine reductase
MSPTEKINLTYLGRPTPAPSSPDEAVIDRVSNAHPDVAYVVRFSAPEFTTLCAVTGQPDFAHFVIDYIPKAWLIESKSLKFYLASFRNHSAFHEECTITIGKRLFAAVDPIHLRISAAECRSMYFASSESCHQPCRCRIKEWRHIAAAGELEACAFPLSRHCRRSAGRPKSRMGAQAVRKRRRRKWS